MEIKKYEQAEEENRSFYELLVLSYYDHYKEIVVKAIDESIFHLDYSSKERIFLGKENFFSYQNETTESASVKLNKKASDEALKKIQEELHSKGWCFEGWKDPDDFGVDQVELYLGKFEQEEDGIHTREFKPEEDDDTENEETEE